MSTLLRVIVNSAIGLLCNKPRDYFAKRLNEGDINDAEFRQIIVRELDDIKTKLDGLSRKDLLASLSCLKDGVIQLYNSLEKYGEYCERPSTTQVHTEDDEPEGATAMTVREVKGDAIDTIYELQKFIANLKIASEERYQSAKKSSEEAKRLATEAFNNTALSTKDRVMAGQLRIASRILGCLDDPEAAIHSCLLYLKELQDLPQIQAMFKVWREGGFRARVNQTERNDMVESIQAINKLLFNLTLQHTNIKMGAFNWPTIKIGEGIYHPILHDKEMINELKKVCYTGKVPWIFGEFRNIGINYNGCAITSNEGLLLRTSEEDGLKIMKPHTNWSEFATMFSENDGYALNKVCCFAVDESDKVYVVTEISSGNKNEKSIPKQYKLLTFDKDGNAIADRALDIIGEESCLDDMTVTKDGKLVIYCHLIKSMYICDSTNAEEDYKFPLPLENAHPDFKELSFTVSDDNEIVYIFPNSNDDIIMHIITMNGEFKREVKVTRTTDNSLNVVFNHVNKTILVSLCCSERFSSCSTFFSFSKEGKLLHKCEMPGWEAHRLASHAKGHITMVSGFKVIMLYM